MNNITKTLLWLAAIILLTLGIWPISFILIIVLIVSGHNQKTKEIEKIKAENQKLRQELQEQAVRRAMDKAESREKES